MWLFFNILVCSCKNLMTRRGEGFYSEAKFQVFLVRSAPLWGKITVTDARPRVVVWLWRAQSQRDAAAAGRQPPSQVERLLEASGKLELLDKMLLRLLPSGHRVLIYSQFTTVSTARALLWAVVSNKSCRGLLSAAERPATESIKLETIVMVQSVVWQNFIGFCQYAQFHTKQELCNSKAGEEVLTSVRVIPDAGHPGGLRAGAPLWLPAYRRQRWCAAPPPSSALPADGASCYVDSLNSNEATRWWQPTSCLACSTIELVLTVHPCVRSRLGAPGAH